MNRLSSENSPYLLQHKDNPIHWYAWGEEAFAEARRQQKPIFLSVGYSTCHWCHVMAHESFEDAEVAQQLNEGFIAIKVDREERPDVDSLYMKALQALSGGGGWPMSVWLTPEGKPFFAGTYYPKYRFMQLLRRIHEVWTNQRQALVSDSEQLLKVVQADDETDTTSGATDASERRRFLEGYVNVFQHVYDDQYGGFGQAPKFPQTMNLMLMMRQDFKSEMRHAEMPVLTTLRAMARGGMYDHLRGGFHRYAVDRQWLVPHFEKMLYDQALISLTLLEAAQLYGADDLRPVLRETLDYVLREMRATDGGFYAAQDADSLNPSNGHGEEGYFATFAWSELTQVLTADELAAVQRVYGVRPEGHFEERSILHLQDGFDHASAKVETNIAAALKKLEAVRSARPAPHLDDKQIAAWNAWMIVAFTRAGRALNEPRYSEAAERALAFIKQKLWIDGRLRRYVRRDAASAAEGTAEDYAGVVWAALEVGRPTDEAWILELQSALDRDFWSEPQGVYLTSSGRDPRLPVRPFDAYDGVHPGANSMAAWNLQWLYALTGETQYRERGERLLARLFPRLRQYPSGLPYLGLAMDLALSSPRVAVVVGEGWPQQAHRQQQGAFAPYIRWLRSDSKWPVALNKEDVGVYVCEAGRCLLPAKSAQEMLQNLRSR